MRHHRACDPHFVKDCASAYNDDDYKHYHKDAASLDIGLCASLASVIDVLA